MMKFNRKVIRITLTLSGKNESFASDNKNKLSATGLRINTEINYGNGAIAPHARIKAYGLPMETMEKLLRIKWNDIKALRNNVTIETGEQGEELSQAFKGGITFAYPDFGDAPNVALVIEAQTAVLEKMTPTDAESYEGEHDVVNIMGNICKRMGYSLDPNGVSEKLSNVYLCNTDIEKVKWLAEAANLNLYIESNTISVTKKGQPRTLKIPVISPETGLISYPAPTMIGVQFKCFYDPLVRFGGIVRITGSQISICNGDWLVYGIRTILETEQDSAQWFMEVAASRRGDNYAAIKK
ncbi:baseplate hub protein [Photorhabdus sp. RM71S]|uniref:baseplate hub protein n=1 Tax=Photorhabdus sp. RM71S TaxID=3342824 RepID=UPI0036DC17F2